MHRVSLLRSTPFRLAIAFSCMVITAFAITGVGVHKLMGLELRQHQAQVIQQMYSVIASAYGKGDLTDMLQAVQSSVQETRDFDRIFLVTDNEGKVLGGNIPGTDFPAGWSELRGASIGADPDLRYSVFAGDVDGFRLMVGASQQELDTLQEILSSSFAWATLLVAILAVGGGALLALRARERFDAVSGTMQAVSQGRLSSRIPLMGRGDDIDLLAGDINAALARLEGTVESMRQVSADIAHDLKTPLNRLRMTIDEAIERERKGKPVGDDLVEAAEEADCINETFEALLRISQIEAGSRKSRFASVDVVAILESLVEIYKEVAQDEGKELWLDIHQSPYPKIFGDRELLTQMFANLVENAIRHCPAGTAIKVRLRVVGDEVVARVEDNGPGIPATERDKVFRRLYRLEKSRTTPGSGLGLSLVKAVADLHDAAVELSDMKPGLAIEIRFRGANVE